MDYKKQIHFINKRLQKIGIDSNDYTEYTIRKLVGEKANEEEPMTFDTYMIYYLCRLQSAALTNDFKEIPLGIKKQLKKVHKQGLLSVYLATVGHMLSSLAPREAYTDLYIGYIESEEKKPFLHGCILIDDKVVDIHGLFVRDGEEALGSYIYGDYGTDLSVWAWKMNGVIPVLIERFMKYGKIDLPCFIKQHEETMINIIGQVVSTHVA